MACKRKTASSQKSMTDVRKEAFPVGGPGLDAKHLVMKEEAWQTEQSPSLLCLKQSQHLKQPYEQWSCHFMNYLYLLSIFCTVFFHFLITAKSFYIQIFNIKTNSNLFYSKRKVRTLINTILKRWKYLPLDSFLKFLKIKKKSVASLSKRTVPANY